MNEVEKYGLFAVVVVGGLIAGIAWWGGEEEPPARADTNAESRPVAIPFNRGKAPRQDPAAAGPAARSAARPDPAAQVARPQAGEPASTREATGRSWPEVRSVRGFLPDDEPFHPNEPPVDYPGERSARPAAAPIAAPATHRVQEGDTLSSIAKTYLGSAQKWNDLLELNPGLDPDRLQIGQVLVVRAGATPARAEPAAAAAPAPRTGGRTYVVKAGDTLSIIAQRELGSVKHTDALFEANRKILESPDKLVVGQTLTIP